MRAMHRFGADYVDVTGDEATVTRVIAAFHAMRAAAVARAMQAQLDADADARNAKVKAAILTLQIHEPHALSRGAWSLR